MEINTITIDFICEELNLFKVGVFDYEINESRNKHILNDRFVFFDTLKYLFSKNDIQGIPSNTAKSGWHQTAIEVNALNIIWHTNFNYGYRLDDKHGIVEIMYSGNLLRTYYDVLQTNQFVEILNFYKQHDNVIELLHKSKGSDFLLHVVVEMGLSEKIIDLLKSSM
jgi:hypothetical protein